MPLVCAALVIAFLIVVNASSKPEEISKPDASIVESEAYTQQLVAHLEWRPSCGLKVLTISQSTKCDGYIARRNW